MTARALLAALGLLAAAALAGCGGGDGDDERSAGRNGSSRTDDAAVPVTEAPAVVVSALDNTFVPEVLKIRPGTEVTFSNDGRNDHNVIPVGDTPFRVDVDAFEPGDSATFTLDEVGRYRYYCSIHGTSRRGMIGEIQVLEGG